MYVCLSVFACRYKAVLSSTSAAETAALSLGVQKANFILKLLSYLTPGDQGVSWDFTPPQARDGVPIMCEQDNKGCIAFAFNPVSTGRLINMPQEGGQVQDSPLDIALFALLVVFARALPEVKVQGVT